MNFFVPITKALKEENLPSGCVYNVDSFQGNEADYVILSSVRNTATGIFGVTAAHECRLDSLPEGNDSCYQQNLSTRSGIREADPSG
ncbi:hypothetical protein BJV77DRAFT_1093367 [Russula vinacea]|nr:hypothetical protein BJV77DRAFT_1093367 [Russula vinacea]